PVRREPSDDGAIHECVARMNALRNASCAGVASARGGSTGHTAFPCEPCIPRRDPQGPREAMKTSLAVTSTRQPDDPLLDVLAEVDVRLVHFEVDPGQDVDQALHLLPVRLGGHVFDLRARNRLTRSLARWRRSVSR